MNEQNKSLNANSFSFETEILSPSVSLEKRNFFNNFYTILVVQGS